MGWISQKFGPFHAIGADDNSSTTSNKCRNSKKIRHLCREGFWRPVPIPPVVPPGSGYRKQMFAASRVKFFLDG